MGEEENCSKLTLGPTSISTTSMRMDFGVVCVRSRNLSPPQLLLLPTMVNSSPPQGMRDASQGRRIRSICRSSPKAVDGRNGHHGETALPARVVVDLSEQPLSWSLGVQASSSSPRASCLVHRSTRTVTGEYTVSCQTMGRGGTARRRCGSHARRVGGGRCKALDAHH